MRTRVGDGDHDRDDREDADDDVEPPLFAIRRGAGEVVHVEPSLLQTPSVRRGDVSKKNDPWCVSRTCPRRTSTRRLRATTASEGDLLSLLSRFKSHADDFLTWLAQEVFCR